MKVFGFFSRRDSGKAATETRAEREARSKPDRPVPPEPKRAAPPEARKAQPPPVVEVEAPTAIDRPAEKAAPQASAPAVEAPRSGVATATMVAEPPAPAAQEAPDFSGDEPDLDASLEAALENAARATNEMHAESDADHSAVRELYADIAGNHAEPVKNFVAELKRGTASKEWIEVCRPVMSTLIQGAHSMKLPDVAQRMTEFDEALSMAAEGSDTAIDETARELILEAYEQMAQTLPESFVAGDDDQRRDTILIHALLKQVSDVGRVSFDRLYSAGLTALHLLYGSSPQDLSATTGIPVALCERICEKLERHRREHEQAASTTPRERLGRLVAELETEHARYEEASEREWTGDEWAERKRDARHKREQCALRIDVELAEMGEIELADRIQKQPLPQRIRSLKEFLSGSASQPAPGSTSPAENR